MTNAVGLLAVFFVILLVVGAATGRIRVNGCCATSDPRRDLRMRGAFDDEPAS